jgi:hypothetical protein
VRFCVAFCCCKRAIVFVEKSVQFFSDCSKYFCTFTSLLLDVLFLKNKRQWQQCVLTQKGNPGNPEAPKKFYAQAKALIV